MVGAGCPTWRVESEGSVRTIELLGQEALDQRWIGLAGGGLHDLANEVSLESGLAGSVLGQLLDVLLQDLRDHLAQGRGVGNLLQALLFDDLLRSGSCIELSGVLNLMFIGPEELYDLSQYSTALVAAGGWTPSTSAVDC